MQNETLDEQLERAAINRDAGREARESNRIIKELEAEIGALRRELDRFQPGTCNKYLEDNLCFKKKGHDGECQWFPF